MLRRLVENGTEVYPGANFIEDENGRRIDLAKQTREQRASHAQTLLTGSTGGGGVGDGMRKSSKVVFRQLLAGDFLLVNRQPTLHKPGIMAHKARILMHDKVIRMHYANCNTYNADFDGDEMNLHFPQDELARAGTCQRSCLCSTPYHVPRSCQRLPRTTIVHPFDYLVSVASAALPCVILLSWTFPRKPLSHPGFLMKVLGSSQRRVRGSDRVTSSLWRVRRPGTDHSR
jgi:hypothetical protein